ncbi:hypothetical protein KIPB_012584, partial [Kipferlia bialata]
PQFDKLSPKFDKLSPKVMATVPEVVVFRKVYPDRVRRRSRAWTLRRLAQQPGLTHTVAPTIDMTAAEKDFEHFLNELEEDPEMRTNVDLYQNPEASADVFNKERETMGSTIEMAELISQMGGMVVPSGVVAEPIVAQVPASGDAPEQPAIAYQGYCPQ